jgi:hypothetical protein
MILAKEILDSKYWETLPVPEGKFYALLRLSTFILRTRRTEPDLLAFLEDEIEKVKREGVVRC